MTASHLLLAVRATIRADSDPARQALFANLTRSSRPARLAQLVHRALGTSVFSTLLVSLYGVWTYVSTAVADAGEPVLLTVAVHSNARHQINRVASWFHGQTVVQVRTGARAATSWQWVRGGFSILAALHHVVRLLRVLHRINGRFSFLVACRSASTLACYVRARELLAKSKPRAVVVSSDTNPEEVAFVAAARALAIPSVYISHAYPSPFSPPLRFDLAILEGDAALESRRARGPGRGTVVLLGVEGESRPLEPGRLAVSRPVIGLCLPKVVAWPVLADVVRECRDVFNAREILVRWHPSMIEAVDGPAARAATPDVTVTTRAESLRDVAMRCDWVLADANSNVHLQVLKLGIPTVAVDGLAVMAAGRSDVYGFCEHRILPPAVASLAQLSLPALQAFYGSDWSDRFVRYDAAYMRDESEMVATAKRAIEQLIERSAKAP